MRGKTTVAEGGEMTPGCQCCQRLCRPPTFQPSCRLLPPHLSAASLLSRQTEKPTRQDLELFLKEVQVGG